MAYFGEWSDDLWGERGFNLWSEQKDNLLAITNDSDVLVNAGQFIWWGSLRLTHPAKYGLVARPGAGFPIIRLPKGVQVR